VYAAWLTLFVPLCVLAMLVLPPGWAVLLVWWLKPVLERVVLHVLAAGVFGDLPRLRDTLRALPRALTPGLIASLTWYRFFLVRSFNLPVWQLERQTGPGAPAAARRLALPGTPCGSPWRASCSSWSWRCPGSRCSTCSCRCWRATSFSSSSCSAGTIAACSRSCCAPCCSPPSRSWSRSTWRAASPCT
jgi:hypothetical protein